MNESDFKSAMTQNSPEAEIGFPVNSISIATFLELNRPKATPGWNKIIQYSPLNEKIKLKFI